ncbi:MAG TPA: histidine kinase [Steroidobacteraceae bacterium]|jgi:PAS domain S-box-containing protein|nr:histidine kinase [Steroidobacteraceae bacterium]
MSARIAQRSVFEQLAAPRGGMRRLLPAVVNWTLIVYAIVLCAVVWGFAVQRIESDYRTTLQMEREHLVSVSGTLEAQVEAMLGDGVGAALAAANELGYRSDLADAGDAAYSDTLAHMLTGGTYVRSLFLVDVHRFVRVGRTSAPETRTTAPEWLMPALSVESDVAWVGAPIFDPEKPSERVIPIARRVVRGKLRGAWAGALIAFSPLNGVYQQSESGSGVGLFAKDGTALLLVPESQMGAAEGKNIADSEIYKRVTRGPDADVIEGVSPYVGRATIVAYHRVHEYPIVAEAARRREETLEGWYGRRRSTVLSAIGITLLVIAATWMLNNSLRTLRRREHHYRTLFNNAAFGAFVLEGERIIEANRTSAAMFGTGQPNVLIGMRLWDLSPTTQPDGNSSEVMYRGRIRHTVDSSAASFEWILLRLDTAQPFPAAVHLSSLDADGKTLTLAVIHDVSERKLVDEERERVLDELHELAATLVHVQDDERRRVGRELHDSTGQCLVALELSLTRLARMTEEGPNPVHTRVEECVTLARKCSTEIRTASYLLHPPLLDEIGLLSALRWLADGLRQRSGIEIELELPDSLERLPPEHELAIFRVAQEALTNVHRHSKSPSVAIRLFERDGAVIMEVEDVGHGILVAGLSGKVTDAAALGVGLAGMRERMRQLGGSLTVHTDPRGTCVQAKLPLARAAGVPTGQRISL